MKNGGYHRDVQKRFLMALHGLGFGVRNHVIKVSSVAGTCSALGNAMFKWLRGCVRFVTLTIGSRGESGLLLVHQEFNSSSATVSREVQIPLPSQSNAFMTQPALARTRP